MRIAYLGSCLSKNFSERVLPDAEIVFRAYRVNTISFCDDRPCLDALPESLLERCPEPLRKRLRYEAKKGFIEALRNADPEVVVLDFLRDIRLPVIDLGPGCVSYPYELLDSGPDIQDMFRQRYSFVEVGSAAYFERYWAALELFCTTLRRECRSLREVVVFHPHPVSDYRGVARSKACFEADYLAWQLRLPLAAGFADDVVRRLDNAHLYVPGKDIGLFSDDGAEYGPSPMHYARECWPDIAEDYRRQRGRLAGGNADPARALRERCESHARFLFAGRGGGDGTAPAPAQPVIDAVHQLVPYLLAGGFDPGRQREALASRPLEPKDVMEGFRWVLGRYPEGQGTFFNHLGLPDAQALREVLLTSQEFRQSYEELRQAMPAEAS